MKARNLQTSEIIEVTGNCNLRDDDGNLFIAVSYLAGEDTHTINFPVNEDTGEIYHPGFELIK